MIFGTFIAMGIAIYFGLPVLVVLVGAAAIQGGIAFALTGKPVAISLTVPVLMVAAVNFLLVPVLTANAEVVAKVDAMSLQFLVASFTVVAYVTAIIGLAGSTIVGLTGDRRSSATSD